MTENKPLMVPSEALEPVKERVARLRLAAGVMLQQAEWLQTSLRELQSAVVCVQLQARMMPEPEPETAEQHLSRVGKRKAARHIQLLQATVAEQASELARAIETASGTHRYSLEGRLAALDRDHASYEAVLQALVAHWGLDDNELYDQQYLAGLVRGELDTSYLNTGHKKDAPNA